MNRMEMEAHLRFQRAVRNCKIDLNETTFAGKSRLKISDLRKTSQERQKDNFSKKHIIKSDEKQS